MNQTLMNLNKGLENLEESQRLRTKISKLQKCELRQSLLESVDLFQNTSYLDIETVKDKMDLVDPSPPVSAKPSQKVQSLIDHLRWFSHSCSLDEIGLFGLIIQYHDECTVNDLRKLSSFVSEVSSFITTPT